MHWIACWISYGRDLTLGRETDILTAKTKPWSVVAPTPTIQHLFSGSTPLSCGGNREFAPAASQVNGCLGRDLPFSRAANRRRTTYSVRTSSASGYNRSVGAGIAWPNRERIARWLA
jgi:hypothetical protein